MWGGTSRSTQVHIVLVPANQHINQQKPSSNNNKPEGWTIASLVLLSFVFCRVDSLRPARPRCLRCDRCAWSTGMSVWFMRRMKDFTGPGSLEQFQLSVPSKNYRYSPTRYRALPVSRIAANCTGRGCHRIGLFLCYASVCQISIPKQSLKSLEDSKTLWNPPLNHPFIHARQE